MALNNAVSSHHIPGSSNQIKLKVAKLPRTDDAFTNRVYLNSSDLDAKVHRYMKVISGPARHFLFTPENNNSIGRGEIAFGVQHRRWAELGLGNEVTVQHFSFSVNDNIVTSIILEADFQKKPSNPSEPLDSDIMAREFLMQFATMVFTRGQEVLFQFTPPQKNVTYQLKMVVKKLEGVKGGNMNATTEIEFGPLNANATVIFDKMDGSQLSLIGRSKGKSTHRALINPDWDFQQMGIGGLDLEFSAIFRRAFASRVFPPEFIEQLGMKHVRGILLYGPPGTGKTLIARQIGKMLNAREPKVVDGPEILNKFVGESEANMRKLFADAEEEWRRCGANSGLHIIIFDEIDAICKQRGSMTGSTGVHDTVVNQLLTKLDGVEQLNNILVIGMTNRKDMIDEALLRPGRMEVQLEISLPDEDGREQILKIHTSRMREFKKIDPDINMRELAQRTKNFSGAEIEGLVRAAQSSAMNRLVKAGGKVQVDEDAIEKLMINPGDFDYALKNDVKPAFGHSDEELDRFLFDKKIINWSDVVNDVIQKGDLLIRETASPETRGFVRVLLAGPRNSGKTFLAAKIAKKSEFPFIKVCSPDDMVGYSETAKCLQLKKIFEDAYKSTLSCILIDNIERLLDYSPIGARYSNLVLQALLVLLGKRPPKNHRLMVIATTSTEHFLREVDLLDSFSSVITVPRLTTIKHITLALKEIGAFGQEEIKAIAKGLSEGNYSISIGIKRLLEIVDFARQSEGDYRVNLILEFFQNINYGID